MLGPIGKQIPAGWKTSAGAGLKQLLSRSLRAATREQGLSELARRLEQIVPDITKQYTTHPLADDYAVLKVRSVHAFQISLVQRAIELVRTGANEPLTLVDIGDSAGTHLLYLRGLYGELRSLSVNLDAEAVAKIRSKGLEAIHARAEDLHKYDISPDIFTCFETFEHLHAPLVLLEALSRVQCKSLVVTVPYVADSRVALDYIRNRQEKPVSPEAVHVFELSPADWRPLFRFAGWRIVEDRIYRQYPKMPPLSLTKPIWKSIDFEGFYGAVLVPDRHWRSFYTE